VVGIEATDESVSDTKEFKSRGAIGECWGYGRKSRTTEMEPEVKRKFGEFVRATKVKDMFL